MLLTQRQATRRATPPGHSQQHKLSATRNFEQIQTLQDRKGEHGQQEKYQVDSKCNEPALYSSRPFTSWNHQIGRQVQGEAILTILAARGLVPSPAAVCLPLAYQFLQLFIWSSSQIIRRGHCLLI